MISINYQRLGLALGATFTLGLSGIALLELGLETTGLCFLLVAILLVGYAVFWRYFRRRPQEKAAPLVYVREVEIAAVSLAVLSVIGAIDAADQHWILTIFFLELLLFVGVFAYVNFLKRKAFSAQDSTATNYYFPSWMYVLFFIGNGVAILASKGEFEGQELFALATIAYFIALLVFSVRWLFRQAQHILQLRTERAKTELQHLQSQVSPHFFFNMLNNLYGWVDKDPKQAQQMILRLSDLMRYSIYDGQKEEVSLAEEIAYLENYMALHKSRYHQPIPIDFRVQLPNTSLRIKPLLFLILVENAFKHGIENLREGAFVNISLSAEGPSIQFVVENNFDPESEPAPPGIGLQNLRRRLELVYPGQHQLLLTSENKLYRAYLSINLPV